jgi:hypothetical protein
MFSDIDAILGRVEDEFHRSNIHISCIYCKFPIEALLVPSGGGSAERYIVTAFGRPFLGTNVGVDPTVVSPAAMFR